MITKTAIEVEHYRETYCKDCKGLLYCRTVHKFCDKVVVELAEDKYHDGFEEAQYTVGEWNKPA